MISPTGADIVKALKDALHKIHNPTPRKAVCECGSVYAFEGVVMSGWHCGNGHALGIPTEKP